MRFKGIKAGKVGARCPRLSIGTSDFEVPTKLNTTVESFFVWIHFVATSSIVTEIGCSHCVLLTA